MGKNKLDLRLNTARPKKDINYQLISLRKLAHAIKIYYLSLKNSKFSSEKNDIFLIFAQNIDCGYTLEPPRRGGSNEYP